MKQILRIILEGTAQAWQQLAVNKLRSFLSLLGVTIGIFCIIGVKSAVDSLEANIRNSMQKLGNDVIYVDKHSWSEDRGSDFWKWMRRPNITFQEFERLEEDLELAEKIGFLQFLTIKTVKWGSASVDNNAVFLGVTEDCSDLFHIEYDDGGRFISPTEYQSGADVCIIGNTIAKRLFGDNIDPLDKDITVGGRKLRIVGVIKEKGKDIINIFEFDECVLVGFTLARRAFGVRAKGLHSNTMLMVKAKPETDIEALKDEIIGVFRAQRQLKPQVENNFALNTLSVLSGLFDSVFGALNLAGALIGIFSLLVGMFSVANIMFVSVKERTGIIGIKMALGAKRWFILLEILIEAVTLCLVGGLLGLFLIWIATIIITKAFEFEIFLSVWNIFFGLITSSIVGIVSGLVPAFQASKLDPVEAIRK